MSAVAIRQSSRHSRRSGPIEQKRKRDVDALRIAAGAFLRAARIRSWAKATVFGWAPTWTKAPSPTSPPSSSILGPVAAT